MQHQSEAHLTITVQCNVWLVFLPVLSPVFFYLALWHVPTLLIFSGDCSDSNHFEQRSFSKPWSSASSVLPQSQQPGQLVSSYDPCLTGISSCTVFLSSYFLTSLGVLGQRSGGEDISTTTAQVVHWSGHYPVTFSCYGQWDYLDIDLFYLLFVQLCTKSQPTCSSVIKLLASIDPCTVKASHNFPI